MPSAAPSVTVKKYDNVTDIIYSLINSAGADGTVALYRAPALNGTVASQPTFESWSRWNGPKTARRVDFRYVYPQALTDTNTGLVVVRNQAVAQSSFIVPIQMDQPSANEFAAQFTRLCAVALMVDAIRTGSSLT